MRSDGHQPQLRTHRLSQRRVLMSALLAVAVMMGTVMVGCESDGAEPVEEADLNQVDLPVLIANGEADTLVGSPDELAAAIPGARLVKIPERDHLTVVPDARFKEAVVQFLAEVSAP